jgi:hypothetical protein
MHEPSTCRRVRREDDGVVALSARSMSTPSAARMAR